MMKPGDDQRGPDGKGLLVQDNAAPIVTVRRPFDPTRPTPESHRG